jgi:hypothetical protein
MISLYLSKRNHSNANINEILIVCENKGKPDPLPKMLTNLIKQNVAV